MKKKLLAKFGKDRLVAAGLVRPGEEGRGDYCYQQELPSSRTSSVLTVVVGLQARASAEREATQEAHRILSC